MKRILALMAIFTLLITTAVACSKKSTGADSNTTPSVNGEGNTPTSDELNNILNNVESISFVGYFTQKSSNLSVYLSNSGLYVNGVTYSNADDSPLVLSGPLTYLEDTRFIYEDGEDKLTFTFAANALTVTVNKGNTYTAFNGTFNRTTANTLEGSGSVVPKSGSVLETLGRIALTYYMVNTDDSSSYTFNAAATDFDNATMLKFLSLYADLFLTGEAEPLPEVSEKYLCYKFAKEDLNKLLLASTAGKFGVDNLSITDSDIVLLDDYYCIPCTGTYAGGIASNYTDENPVDFTNLTLEASVIKMDGTRYDLEMTLSTSNNEALVATGVQIDSVTYKTVE